MNNSLQKNTIGVPCGGGSSAAIMAGEKAAVKEQMAAGRIPTPDGYDWAMISAFYELPPLVKMDNVQSRVTLPPGWKIRADPSDPYGRCTKIIDHEGQVVGSTFLKNTGYDYYGCTSFNKERLIALGIYRE
jgi:hypothetical protein